MRFSRVSDTLFESYRSVSLTRCSADCQHVQGPQQGDPIVSAAVAVLQVGEAVGADTSACRRGERGGVGFFRFS